MKREHSFILGMAAVVCFALLGCTRTYNYYTTKSDKCVFDSSEVKKLRAENKKARSDVYWIAKQRDQLKIDKHELQGKIGDTNVFPIMRFTDEGKLIQPIIKPHLTLEYIPENHFTKQ